ncbi:DUF7622 domain-containing protein [Caenorhabditis elegans]|uniref:DUF7622 domain-containing protein n=1 Tax=Caenorhabditis elegans TaxID=6239 RepID=O16623_CAEEL|nr:Activin_recp domain-containing protein [Caenorhabditis elegans]CCD70640.3 Activin_recp domain-containing protein [Caenorhabditis elegans]|eukprot:NP_503505.4 Uncharacterized protein CELE_F36H9.1 [Caenorhabditis elegans]
MNVFSIFALGFLFKNCSCFQCYCQGQNGDNCVNGFCETENYCIKSWIVANGADCLNTRTDLSDRQCQKNRRGLVSCICNSDKCNDDSFTIPSDVVLTIPPVIKCFSQDLIEDNYCFGHYCTYEQEYIRNDFGDAYTSINSPSRGCSDLEYAEDLNSPNMCRLLNGLLECQCSTPYCNRDQPFEVPMGNTLCYYREGEYDSKNIPARKHCRGHVCVARIDKKVKELGCLSVSDGAPEESKTSGANMYFKFCNEDECNGDYIVETSTPQIEANSVIE